MMTSKAIYQAISGLRPGEPFTPARFASLGSRGSIHQTLMRLTQDGRIKRIGRGLYTVPSKRRSEPPPLPSPRVVAQTVAATEGATVEMHGAEAAQRFGFKVTPPPCPMFYTTGSSRTLHVGAQVVRLLHVAPRKLILAGRPAGEALAALWYLGRRQVTPETFARIAAQLPAAEFEALRKAKPWMPGWMIEALRGYEEKVPVAATPTRPTHQHGKTHESQGSELEAY